MTWILLTNDDGVDAPGLPALAEALAAVAPTRVVVPHIERSWIGKAITRYEDLHVDLVTRNGIEMHAVTGYPADCVQLGVHTMFDDSPALVVSGINIGQNHGTSFVQCSGTVGAILEAAIAGIDGIAFSTGTTGPFRQWRERIMTPEALPVWERLAEIAADMTDQVLSAGQQGVALSVNMPDHATLATERRITTMAETGYGRLFREAAPGRYEHHFVDGLNRVAPGDDTDLAAARDGAISIVAVEGIRATGLPPDLAILAKPSGGVSA